MCHFCWKSVKIAFFAFLTKPVKQDGLNRQKYPEMTLWPFYTVMHHFLDPFSVHPFCLDMWCQKRGRRATNRGHKWVRRVVKRSFFLKVVLTVCRMVWTSGFTRSRPSRNQNARLVAAVHTMGSCSTHKTGSCSTCSTQMEYLVQMVGNAGQNDGISVNFWPSNGIFSGQFLVKMTVLRYFCQMTVFLVSWTK